MFYVFFDSLINEKINNKKHQIFIIDFSKNISNKILSCY